MEGVLQCDSTELEFEPGSLVTCADCYISQDDHCNINDNEVRVKIHLNIIADDDSASSNQPVVLPSRSMASVAIDDSREPECRK